MVSLMLPGLVESLFFDMTVDASYLMTIISLLCASERLPVMLAKSRELSLNKNFPSQSDDAQPL